MATMEITANLIPALILASAAGLCTTIGSFLGLIVKRPSPRYLSAALGFSAGVMIMVSFLELLPEGIKAIGFFPAQLGFFGGIAVFFLIDFFVPHEYAGHVDHVPKGEGKKIYRTGLLLAVGIGIHNFPEGMATLSGSLVDLRLGLAIAIAVALHNIPEGLAVSIPVYAATGSRKRAFFWSFLAGLAEPLGAGLAALLLFPFFSPALLGALLSVAAGIMVFISIDELIPISYSLGEEHVPILAVVLGMALMALSLGILR